MITDLDYKEYQRLVKQGYSQRDACWTLDIARSTMQDYIKKLSPAFEGAIQGFKKEPKILLLDIETSATISAHFGRWKQNIGQNNVISEGGIILVACWKWLGNPNVESDYIRNPKERYNGDDSALVARLWELIESADVVVGQNVLDFDLATIKSRLAKHAMPTLKNVKVVDTLKIARKMRFNANSLDSLGAYLGVGRKLDHSGMKLWIDVMNGCPAALKEMLDYCKQDVQLLEDVYLKLRAFDQRPAGLAHFYADEKHRCPACGSDDLEFTNNVVHTPVSEFQEVICNICHHRSRKRTPLNTKGKQIGRASCRERVSSPV